MNFADIHSMTKIDPIFSMADEATILAAMKTAYEGSSTARLMMDNWISAGNSIYIDFVYRANWR